MVAVGPDDEAPGMEGAQRRPVADADHGGSRESLLHEGVESLLRRLVHRRGLLVEEQPVGLLDKRAGKGDALLLTG